jgi:hypothetical protein
VQLVGLAAGVPTVALGLVLGWTPLLAAGALAVAAVVVAHLTWVAAMLRGRKRPALDPGLRLVLAGAAFLVPATVLGVGLAVDAWSGPRVALAYAIAALGGWASLTIAGMMLKIVPFLVWYRAYSPHVGRAPVPTLAALSWPRAERAAVALLVAGVAALAVAVWSGDATLIRVAGAVTAAGAVAFSMALGRVLAHLRHGVRVAPAPAGAVAAGSYAGRRGP